MTEQNGMIRTTIRRCSEACYEGGPQLRIDAKERAAAKEQFAADLRLGIGSCKG